MIGSAFAQATGGAGAGDAGMLSFLPIILMFVVLYIFMIRPQMKRAKETKQMIDALQKANEILGARLNTLHNLHYYQELMRELRSAIEKGTLLSRSRELLALRKQL